MRSFKPLCPFPEMQYKPFTGFEAALYVLLKSCELCAPPFAKVRSWARFNGKLDAKFLFA
jgi:hypothetical protein